MSVSGASGQHGDAAERQWEGRVLRSNVNRAPEPDRVEEAYPERTPSGGALWAWWAIATALGWAIAGLFAGLVIDPDSTLPVQYVFLILVPLFQWTLLRRHFARSSLWVVATAAGILAAAVTFAVVTGLPVEAWGPASSGIRAGITDLTDGIWMAVAQWLVLRASVRNSGQWIPATLVPITIIAGLDFQRGVEALDVPADLTAFDRAVSVGAGWLLVGGLIGALTGYVLMRLVEDAPTPTE